MFLSSVYSRFNSLMRTSFALIRPYWGLLALLLLVMSAYSWLQTNSQEKFQLDMRSWLPSLLGLSLVTLCIAIVSRTDNKQSTLDIVERYAGWLVFFSYSLTLLAFFVCITSQYQSAALLAMGVFLSVSSTLLALTRPIDHLQLGPDKDGDMQSDPVEEDNYVINGIFRIAYGFIFLCAIGVIALAFNDQSSDDKQYLNFNSENSNELEHNLNTRVHTVIAVVRGCDYQYQPIADDSATTRVERLERRMPIEAECGDLPPQWVLTIGGNVLLCHVLNNCIEAFDALYKIKDVHINLPLLDQELEGLENQNKSLKEQIYILYGRQLECNIYQKETNELKSQATCDDLEQSLSITKQKQTLISTSINQQKQKIKHAKQQLVYRQQAFDNPVLLGRPITGGIVVPVYFMILAIIGALINMARKLPEFQRRITPSYHLRYKTDVKDKPDLATPMTGAEARECVSFQMIQVLTSAGVAIVAYSWAKPEEMAAGVVLAFVAGFSSEVVLMSVRGVAERLIGQGTRKIELRTVVDQPQKKSTKQTTQSAVTPQPSPALIASTVSLAPLIKGQKVKLLHSQKLPDGVVLELLTEGTIASINENDISVRFDVDGKQINANVNRSDIAPSEQVGASKDDLKG